MPPWVVVLEAAEDWHVPPWVVEEQATMEWWYRWLVMAEEKAAERKRSAKKNG